MDNIPEIHCPDCNNRLSQDLTRILLSGNSVYCERCGFKFTGIEKGEVKEFTLEQQNLEHHNQNKLETQWKVWKKKWQEIKQKYILPVFNEPSPSQTVENALNTTTPSSLLISTQNKRSEMERRDAKENMDRILPIMHSLNRISLFISFIIIFASFITFIIDAVGRKPALWTDLIVLFYQIYVINLDLHKFIPDIDKKRFSNAGIGLILVGIISSSANGIGGFLILRGVLYLIYTIFALKYYYPNFLPPGSKQSTYFWTREIISTYVVMLGPLLFFNYLFALVAAIQEITIFGNEDLIPLLVIGGIALLIFNGGALPQIQKSHLTKIEDGWIIACLIIGGITMGLYGLGMMLIFLMILLILCKDALSHFAGTIPSLADLCSIPQNTSDSFPIQPGAPSQFVQAVPEPVIPSGNMITNIPPGGTIRYRRFNPQTGEPYPVPIAEMVIEAAPMIQTSIPQKTTSMTPQKNEVAVPIELTHLFTVLDPDVRNRLLQLPISENERIELSKALVILAKKEQLRFLTELEEVNQTHPKEMQQNIDRINRLPLSQKEKQSLIAQLEYLPLDKQAEFVQFVENSVKN